MQYSFHKWAMRIWLLTGLILVPLVFFEFPHLWFKIDLFFLTEISVYACWGMHLGSMPSAEAASKGNVSAFAKDEAAE